MWGGAAPEIDAAKAVGRLDEVLDLADREAGLEAGAGFLSVAVAGRGIASLIHGGAHAAVDDYVRDAGQDRDGADDAVPGIALEAGGGAAAVVVSVSDHGWEVRCFRRGSAERPAFSTSYRGREMRRVRLTIKVQSLHFDRWNEGSGAAEITSLWKAR